MIYWLSGERSLPFGLLVKKGEKYIAGVAYMHLLQTPSIKHIIGNNINKHLAFESILADCQHDFRSQRSYEIRLVQFYHDMVSILDGARDRGHKETGVIIMDFAKAFDKVLHRRLFYSLDHYGLEDLLTSGSALCSMEDRLGNEI